MSIMLRLLGGLFSIPAFISNRGMGELQANERKILDDFLMALPIAARQSIESQLSEVNLVGRSPIHTEYSVSGTTIVFQKRRGILIVADRQCPLQGFPTFRLRLRYRYDGGTFKAEVDIRKGVLECIAIKPVLDLSGKTTELTEVVPNRALAALTAMSESRHLV